MMKRSLVVIVVTLAVVLRSVSAASNCSICAEGETIGLPDQSIVISGYPTLTCSLIQSTADGGTLTSSQCSQLPLLSTQCDCKGGSSPTTSVSTKSPVAPTKKPVAPTKKPVGPTKTPVAPTASSPVDTTGSTCSICPAGETIQNPDTLVTISNLGSLTCSEFEARASVLAATGLCSQLSSLATQCGCSGGSTPSAPVSSPTSPQSPTRTPTAPTQSTTNSSCSVCPAGESIGNPDALITIANLGSLTCSEFEARASQLAATGICNELPSLSSQCGCTSDSAPSPTFSPVASTAVSPSPSQLTSPTVTTTNSSCSICPAGETIGNPDALVTIANLGSLTCSQFEARASQLAATGICSQLPSLASQCGCSGGSAGSPSVAPVSDNSCSVCPAGKNISNPDALITIANLGSLTCSQFEARAAQLAATGLCSGLPSLESICGCTTFAPVASTAASYTPSQSPASASSSSCSICPAGQTIKNPGVLITFENIGSMNCSEIERRAPALAATGICSQLSSLSSQCGCQGSPTMVQPSAPSYAPVTVSSCAICPDGEEIGKPKQNVSSGSGVFTCSQLQAYANQRIISTFQCSQMPSFAEDCGCVKSSSAPNAAPAPQPSVSTTPSSSSQNGTGICSICPSGQTIEFPHTQVEIFGVGKYNCSEIQASADAGKVPAEQCDALQTFAPECGCMPVSSTPTPAAPVSAPTAPAPTSSTTASNCSICATGETIGTPGKSVTIPGYPTFTCSEIQGLADSGQIPAGYCVQLPQLATECSCTAPTPVTVPTIAPIAPSTTPVAAAPTCSICAAGQTIGNPDVEVDTGSTGKLSCKSISDFAASGQVPKEQCSQLPMLASTCGCKDAAPSTPGSAPVSSEAPTVTSTYPPTQAVTTKPHASSSATAVSSWKVVATILVASFANLCAFV